MFPPPPLSFSGLFKAVLSLRHGNGWIGLNELSSLSVKVRIVEICGTFGFIFFGKGLLDEDDQGPKWGGEITPFDRGISHVYFKLRSIPFPVIILTMSGNW